MYLDEGSIVGGSIGSPQAREPRLCVLRQRQERTALQRALEHLLKGLEKRDPQQFFAWPVTDAIAPGYSAIITNPMDFSTMRQKIDDTQYTNLQDFMNDFRLMCNNAMQYNHIETVYYKASKKLLHAGLKLVQPDKLGWLLTYVPELTSREIGFEITAEFRNKHRATIGIDGDEHDMDIDGTTNINGSNNYEPKRHMPTSRFEAIRDDLLPDEILAQAQAAARNAKAKLSKF
jgi:bromodomain-containing protein 7